MVKLFNIIVYGATLLSLFLIDYLQGNGLVDVLKKLFCKIVCFVRKTTRDEKLEINFPVLISEFTFFGLTMVFLRKLRHRHSKDRIDDLLQESKNAIKQTDEFLEKWRLRKLNWQTPSEYSYLDEEPQEIKPLRLEVPILHMAIIDTMGERNQFERGDAGDTVTIPDSTLLSMTSLLDDDLQSIPEPEERIDVSNNIDFDNRCLWDVMEEDGNYED